MCEDQICMNYSQKHFSNIDLEAYHNVITQDLLEWHRGWSGIITGSYLLKVDNRNTRTRCEICPKLTMATPEQHQLKLFSYPHC